MHGAAEHLKHGSGAFEVHFGATGHDGQGARLRAQRAARDRRIERVQAQGGQAPRLLFGLLGQDGAHVHQQGARFHRGRRTVITHAEQHVANGSAVRQHGDDDVGLAHCHFG